MASLEDVTWDPLVMKARVPTAPVIELGDYGAMRLEVEAVEVSEEEINETLEDLRREQAVWNPVERPAQMGDRVVGVDLLAVPEKLAQSVQGGLAYLHPPLCANIR